MFHDCRPNTRGTAVEQQWNIVVQVPRFGRPGFEPVTLEKVLKSVPKTGIRTQTTSKIFCNMADSNLGKTQKSGLAGIRTGGESESMPYGRPCTRFTLLGLRTHVPRQ